MYRIYNTQYYIYFYESVDPFFSLNRKVLIVTHNIMQSEIQTDNFLLCCERHTK
jgi:hypothetical protein